METPLNRLLAYGLTVASFIYLVFYLEGAQHPYYLEKDIDHLLFGYIIPLTSAIITSFYVFVHLKQVKAFLMVKRTLFYMLPHLLVALLYFFVLERSLMATTIFLNRQFNNGEVNRCYVVGCNRDRPQAKEPALPSEIAQKDSLAYKVILSQLQTEALKPGRREPKAQQGPIGYLLYQWRALI